MAKINIDIEEILQSLRDIGYVINDCIERENNGKNWQVKFSNSGASVTIYDSNRTKNSVVNGKLEPDEGRLLKELVDGIKCKEIVITELNRVIVSLINTQKEDTFYDFKREFSGNKGDLLHDILCLSNNTENRESYLIIGVDDSFNVVGIQETIKSNYIFDFLRSQSFAGDHLPEIDVEEIYYKYQKLVVIVCKSSKYVPFYLIKRYEGVNPYQIYTRTGDTNTPKNEHANYSDTEKLWRIHFEREYE